MPLANKMRTKKEAALAITDSRIKVQVDINIVFFTFSLHISRFFDYNIVYDVKEGIMNYEDIVHNPQVKLAISLKHLHLQREELASLTYQQVEATMLHYLWKYKKPASLHQAVDDIFALQLGEIVGYLSNQAIVVGSQMELDDFQDLIGGH